MKTTLTIKEVIWIVICVVITTVLILSTYQSLINFSKSDGDWIGSLIGSLGNIIGGIIGGIVAYIVATYQVNKTLGIEVKKQQIQNISAIKLIREEIRDNISLIESSVPFEQKEFKLLKSQLSDEIWKNVMFNIQLDDDLLVRLTVCYKKISMLKNLDAEDVDDELLKDIKDQLNPTLEKVKEKTREE